MKQGYYSLLVLLLLFSCSHHQKSKDGADSVSIHKIWEFKKIDTLRSPPGNLGSVWIGKNQLDLTNMYTLKFSYQSNNRNPTSYPYSIIHDTIFIQHSAGYKISKLTGKELYLMALFKHQPGFIMVYEVKQK